MNGKELEELIGFAPGELQATAEAYERDDWPDGKTTRMAPPLPKLRHEALHGEKASTTVTPTSTSRVEWPALLARLTRQSGRPPVNQSDAPIAWGNHSVKFVLLIGIAEQDMAMFRGAFDIIVETFMSVDKTLALLRTSRYDEFVEAFLRAV